MLEKWIYERNNDKAERRQNDAYGVSTTFQSQIQWQRAKQNDETSNNLRTSCGINVRRKVDGLQGSI